MNEAAIETERSGADPFAFLREAIGALRRRDLIVPAFLLALILTFSNIVILLNLPTQKGALPPTPFIAAAIVRLAGLLVLAVGILRLLTGSERPRWRPDGGFWLYVLTFVASAVVSAGLGALVGDRGELPTLIVSNIVVTVLLSPLIVWFVAIAVTRPLAWRPGPWLQGLGRWLPSLLLWSLLLATPMAVLHAWLDLRLIQGVGNLFWPIALFDGVLSAAMALLGLGLGAAAYRRVAPG